MATNPSAEIVEDRGRGSLTGPWMVRARVERPSGPRGSGAHRRSPESSGCNWGSRSDHGRHRRGTGGRTRQPGPSHAARHAIRPRLARQGGRHDPGHAPPSRVSREGIGLDDPVCRDVPEFTESGRDQVTLRQLLGHTSGLPAEACFWTAYREPEAARRAPRSMPLGAVPGSLVEYSNVGFLLLGEVSAPLLACRSTSPKRSWSRVPWGWPTPSLRHSCCSCGQVRPDLRTKSAEPIAALPSSLIGAESGDAVDSMADLSPRLGEGSSTMFRRSLFRGVQEPMERPGSSPKGDGAWPAVEVPHPAAEPDRSGTAVRPPKQQESRLDDPTPTAYTRTVYLYKFKRYQVSGAAIEPPYAGRAAPGPIADRSRPW